MDILLKDPMVWGSILVMPLAIIGLAVFWKKLKERKTTDEQKQGAE